MYNPDTDLLFPTRVLPVVRDLRGFLWQDLIAEVISSGADSLQQIALVLMMVRMNNCTTCNSDSYRALNGCTACTKQSLRRFRQTDEALIEIYHATRADVDQYLQKKAISYFKGGPLDHLKNMTG
jgi:hypothetical protein